MRRRKRTRRKVSRNDTAWEYLITKPSYYILSGLAAKEDPAQKEKEETREWLNEGVDALKQQIDKLEAEVEKDASVKKKTSKELKRLEQLKKFIERHNYHIQRFELLIRFMDNDSGILMISTFIQQFGTESVCRTFFHLTITSDIRASKRSSRRYQFLHFR